jgi:hypothetical protein
MTNTSTADTPRSAAAAFSSRDPFELMKTSQQLELELAASKAEVERLREQLQQAVDIAEWYMDNLVDSPRKEALAAIKVTLKPTDK